MDCLFVICILLKAFLKKNRKKIKRDFWLGCGIWYCQLLTSLHLGGKLTHSCGLSACLQRQVDSGGLLAGQLFMVLLYVEKKKVKKQNQMSSPFLTYVCIYFVYSAVVKGKQTVF